MASALKQSGDDDFPRFSLLSPNSKRAFAVAEAARRLTNKPRLEIAHLIYGLYNDSWSACRKVMNEAGIGDDRILSVLGLDGLDQESVRSKAEELSDFPPLDPHTRQALKNANEIRLSRGYDYIRMRYLLAGALKVTECSLIRALLDKHHISFDLDEYEKRSEVSPASAELLWKNMTPTARRAFAMAAAMSEEVHPVHLLAGFFLSPEANSQPPITSFLIDVLSDSLPDEGNQKIDSLSRITSRLGLPPTVSPKSLTTLPSLSPECLEVVKTAERLRMPGIDWIHARHLVAGLLLKTEPDSEPPAASILSQAGFDLSQFPKQFLEYIKRGVPFELDQWDAIINDSLIDVEYVDADDEKEELANPTRAVVANDSVPEEIKAEDDRLNLAHEVERFARLLVACDVKPPISLGLFGNWGSGKSFFMRLIKNRVDELTKSDKTKTYVAKVVQIDFNAWHYVDSNLWASLAVRIFDGLAQSRKGSAVDNRKELHQKIESSKKLLEQAESQQAAAKKQRAEAGKQLEKFKEARSKDTDELTAAKMIRFLIKSDFKQEKQAFERLSKAFGLSKVIESKDDVRRLFDEMKAIRGRASAMAAALSASFKGGRAAVSLAIAVLIVAAVATLGPLRESVEWIKSMISDASLAIAQVATLVSTAAVWARRRIAIVSDALRKAESFQSKLQSVEEQGDVPPEEQALQEKIANLDAEIQHSSEQMAEADRIIAQTEAQIQRIKEGGLVYDFLDDRRQSSRYLDQLGLISTIRADFEKLGDLLNEWRQNGDDPIERIILYVDDLDRCHPDQVVEVLQAVHLLLAFDLFNVVVGVDARWLERSLYRTYIGDTTSAQVAGSRAGADVFSPQNYLEKIFQIPYSLPHMSSDGFRSLIDGLVTTRSDNDREASMEKPAEENNSSAPLSNDADAQTKTEEKAGSSETRKASGETQTGDKTEITQSAHEDQKPVDTRTVREPIFLEDEEEKYLQSLYEFVPTPRLVKRFVNVYKLIRMCSTKEDFGKFISGQYKAAMLLLAINTGFPATGSVLLRLLSRPLGPGTWTEFLKQIDPRTPEEERMEWAKRIQWLRQDDEYKERHKDLIKVLDRIEAIRKDPGITDDIEHYKHWVRAVGRYSFQWHTTEEDENTRLSIKI